MSNLNSLYHQMIWKNYHNKCNLKLIAMVLISNSNKKILNLFIVLHLSLEMNCISMAR